MENILIKNAFIVNEGILFKGDIKIKNNIIEKINSNIETQPDEQYKIINAEGKYVFPGIIDNHVHFREPGLTHKADLETESSAAVAGGITSYMEMPNTIPLATTIENLEHKFELAAQKSKANFSFYLGVTSNNLDEILKSNTNSYCGLKLFLGSSTGNLKVENKNYIEQLFKEYKQIIALHCEDDTIIKENFQKYYSIYGDNIPFSLHSKIRDAKACFESTKYAVDLAKKHNTKIHILHLSTADELVLLENTSIENKKITAEACVHHLWFSSDDYEQLGSKIKWNPSIKDIHHRSELRKALSAGLIDVIGTDHAPHLLNEKNSTYANSPSGAPLVQFALQVMLQLVDEKVITLEKLVELMSHNPAKLFNIKYRGFIREGYFADLVIVDRKKSFNVTKDIILSKCGWSPLEGQKFNSTIDTTIVNGNIVYSNNKVSQGIFGERLEFKRQ